MDIENITRILAGLTAFMALLGIHYAGDHWIQTGPQSVKKALDRNSSAASAHWHCLKHVLTYTAAGAILLLGLAAWFDLPIQLGWLAAGLAVNAVTHYVADLRTPLRWLAGVLGRNAYIHYCQVQRPTGAQDTGPGTGLFHLDQAWHIFWIVISAAIIAGP